LGLVVVGLGKGLVVEELVLRELEDEAEAGLVEVLHPDVDKVLERGLVPVRNHLRERDLILHGGQPKLRDAVDRLGGLGGLGGLLGRLRLLALSLLALDYLALLDLLIGWFRPTVDDLRA